jgi:hypothetical protein
MYRYGPDEPETILDGACSCQRFVRETLMALHRNTILLLLRPRWSGRQNSILPEGGELNTRAGS